MTETKIKTVTFISRSVPYGSESSQICLELVLAFSVYDQEINYIFLEDGVYQLLKSQHSAGIDSKNLGASLTALEIYGVERVFVDSESMARRNLHEEELIVPAQPLNADQIRSLIRSSDAVFNL